MANKIKRTFHRDLLEDLDLPYKCQDQVLIDQRRWYNIFEGVFEYEGKHYLLSWHDPASEIQEGIDYWDDEDEIECVEVVKLPVVKYEWVPKAEA